MSDLSPLSGEERKSNFGAVRSVDDPERTSCPRGIFLQPSTGATISPTPSHNCVRFFIDWEGAAIAAARVHRASWWYGGYMAARGACTATAAKSGAHRCPAHRFAVQSVQPIAR